MTKTIKKQERPAPYTPGARKRGAVKAGGATPFTPEGEARMARMVAGLAFGAKLPVDQVKAFCTYYNAGGSIPEWEATHYQCHIPPTKEGDKDDDNETKMGPIEAFSKYGMPTPHHYATLMASKIAAQIERKNIMPSIAPICEQYIIDLLNTINNGDHNLGDKKEMDTYLSSTDLTRDAIDLARKLVGGLHPPSPPATDDKQGASPSYLETHQHIQNELCLNWYQATHEAWGPLRSQWWGATAPHTPPQEGVAPPHPPRITVE